ncbi:MULTISPECIES: hypothetical protein [unclassified Methylosinus]|uniref:hypothetical protein n=1 Tax=unclassified Methylosinus TaxID=2624500 RepID=UPI000465BD5B|nr:MULTISPECIES: hypothetical protein [unclassified Methylosinus]
MMADHSTRASGVAPFGRRGLRRDDEPGSRRRSGDEQSKYRRVRLRTLGAELTLVYIADFQGLAPQFLVRFDEDGPYLSVGDPVAFSLASKEEPIGRESPRRPRVLSDADSERNRILLIAGDEDAIDRAAAQAPQSRGQIPLDTADIAVDMLIGYSIEAVERRLVLRTLRRFNGDYRQTAFALGLSTQELSAKLLALLYADASSTAE